MELADPGPGIGTPGLELADFGALIGTPGLELANPGPLIGKPGLELADSGQVLDPDLANSKNPSGPLIGKPGLGLASRAWDWQAGPGIGRFRTVGKRAVHGNGGDLGGRGNIRQEIGRCRSCGW